jgi:hypothetical protein
MGAGLQSLKKRQISITFEGLQQHDPSCRSLSLQRLQETFNGAAFWKVEGGGFFAKVPQQDIKITDRPQRAPQPG